MKYKILLLSALSLTFIFVSCSKEMRQTFADMFELSNLIVEKFGVDAPEINVGGKNLSVTFVNSAFNDLSEPEKQAKAREIALFVKENYRGISEIENILIVFGVHKSFLIFEYNNGFDAHPFKVKDLSAYKPPQ